MRRPSHSQSAVEAGGLWRDLIVSTTSFDQWGDQGLGLGRLI
jgi:hypothetical protein